MAVTLAELTSDLQGWIPNCSDAAARGFLNQSYLEFTSSLPVYRGSHTITTVVDQAEYDISPGGAHGHPTLGIRKILHAIYDTATLNQAITEYSMFEKFVRDYPYYQSADSGTPNIIVIMAPELIRLYPPPDKATDLVLQVYWNGTEMVNPTDVAPNWPKAHKDLLVYDAAFKAAPFFERGDLLQVLKALRDNAYQRFFAWLYDHVPDKLEFDAFDYREDPYLSSGSW